MDSRGFSLIELVVAIVIVSIGVGAFLTAIVNITMHSADPMVRQQAHAIAQSYLEEVLLNSFCDPDLSTDCPVFCSAGNTCTTCTSFEGLANRDQFDDVCDYGNINDQTGAIDQFGNPISGLENYNVNVTVDDNGGTLNGLDPVNREILRVDVNVTHDSVQEINVTLTGYKANF